MASCIPTLRPSSTIFGDPQLVCDTSPRGLTQIFDTVVSQSISKTISDCFQNQSAEQLIRIRCNPRLPDSTIVYEENIACGSCINSILESQLYQMQLQRRLWSGGSSGVRLPIDQFYTNLLAQMDVCGTTYCKACALSNVTQSNIVQSDASCISVAMTSTNIQSNLNSSLQQMLLSNQDILAATATTLGIKDVASISSFISSNMMVVMNSQFLSRLQETLKQSQVIEVISQTSVKLNNISQTSTMTVTQQFVSSTQVTLNALSEVTINQISAQIQQQNTLNEIGNVVVNTTTTFLGAMNNAVGQIMLACIVMLGAVVLGIMIYFIYTNIQNQIAKRAREKANKEKKSPAEVT